MNSPIISNTLALIDPSWEGLQWVLAIALTVLALDIFFATEILSWLALLGTSTYLSLLISADAKWRVLVTLCIWLASMWVFLTIGRRLVRLVNRKITGGGEEEFVSGLEDRLRAVGSRGRFREIDGTSFVEWNGDLWPAHPTPNSNLSDGQAVSITRDKEGIFEVEPTR